jgi:hypothetical protein
MAVGAAILWAGATVHPARAQTLSGSYQIVDGPGAGAHFDAVNGIVTGGGFSGQIENHGGSCNGPHFHGTINGVADPNPMGCGWGHVAPLLTGGATGPEQGAGSGREQLGLTADPSSGSSGMRLGSPDEHPRIASLLLETDSNGALLPKLQSDIAPVTGATTTNPNLDPAAVQAEAKQRLQTIFTTFKGTGDLAGVAEALLGFNRWYTSQTGRPYYEWAGEAKNYPNSPTSTTSDTERFQSTPQLACYEFVHFCAYIASDQPQRPVVLKSAETDDEGNITKPDVLDPNRTSVYWGFPVGNPRTTIGNGTSVGEIIINEASGDARDNPGQVQRGQIVTGIGRWANNTMGYNHVGIAVGNGQVISLGSGGLKKDAMGGLVTGAFSKLGFSFVYAGDYQWQKSNPAPAHPTVPLTASKP